MRRLALIFVLLSAAPLMWAQATYWRWDGSLQNPSGQAIGGAKVYIYSQQTGGLATLYANNAGTSLPVNCGTFSGIGNQIINPLTTNGYGEVCAYLASNCYTIQYVSPTTGTKIYTDQGPGCIGSGTFLPISGGSLSGGLGGTTAAFTGNISSPNLTGSQTGNFFYASPNGAPGAPAWRSIVASDVPTLNQSTTGTALGLTGSQTGNFFYAAPNGTSGAGVWRAVVAADIPTLNQNTSGTAAGLSGTPAISVASVTLSGSCAGKYTPADGTACSTPPGTLPAATDTFNTVQVNSSNAGTPYLSTAAGTWEAVQNGGADNTGAVDPSTILNTKTTALCSSSTPVRIHLAAGTYNVNSGWTIAATSTTCKNMVIEGDGSANTILQSTCAGANKYVIAWINATSPSAEHFNGPTFRHMTIKNNGGTACNAGLIISQSALFKVEDVVITGFVGQTYATGTIASTGATITGTGTTFTAAMVHGFIETTSGNTTTRSEVCAFGSATSLTLCASAFPNGNIAGGTSYGLAYGGDGFVCDPGAGISGSPFTQYATLKDVYASGNLIGIHAWGVNSGGCSRVQVSGNAGYISPNPGSRVTDAVGIFLGHNSDTWEISVPLNNAAACIVNDSGHTNWLNGPKCENGGSFAPVTTCNAGVGIQACTAAWEVSSDSNSNGWNTTITNAYAYKVGNVYQYDNSGGAFNSTITAPRDLSGQYSQHYYFYGTTTCPGNASGIPIMITAYDCNHQLVTQTVN